MKTVTSAALLRETLAPWRAAGERIALVPTMGALHAGHLSLVALARGKAARVVATVFVNPKQFGPQEDFGKYPRDLEGDARKLAAGGVDVLFAPPVEEIYPPGFATTVHVAGVSEGMEGARRPGHFDGVATVVARLFGLVLPDMAVFGAKDGQQVAVIKRLTADLGLPIDILLGETQREPDGLALSSRNAYLNADAVPGASGGAAHPWSGGKAVGQDPGCGPHGAHRRASRQAGHARPGGRRDHAAGGQSQPPRDARRRCLPRKDAAHRQCPVRMSRAPSGGILAVTEFFS